MLRPCKHVSGCVNWHHQACDSFTCWDQTWAPRPTWVSGEKGIKLKLSSLSFSTPAARVPAGHMTPAWLLKALSVPRGEKVIDTRALLTALVQCWALRGEKKDHGNDDVSKILKRIDLCAAITRTMADRKPLCEAYFTSCSIKPLYIVSIEPDFVENYSPCMPAQDKYSIAARRTRINVFA